MTEWRPVIGRTTPFNGSAFKLFTREGDEDPTTTYVYVPEVRIREVPDLEFAREPLWSVDDTAGPVNDSGTGYMVPMSHWEQRVLLGRRRD